MAWRLHRPWPLLGSIHVAVFILLASACLGWYVDRQNDVMHRQHAAVGAALERMVRLNYALTHTLAIALLEQNALRAASFNTLNDQLTATMQDVVRQTKQLPLAADVVTLQREQSILRGVEKRAYALMLQDDWAAARQLLFTDNYRLSLQLYEINSETLVSALTGELERLAWRHERLRQVSLLLRLVAVLVLLWAGVRHTRRLRVELDEQMKLRQALAVANQDLEDKVHARTAELEAANQRLAALSNTDGLTGLANRRHFDEVWDSEWSRALRQHQPLALIMLDIDHFKSFNDNLGHLAGDECLKRVAQVLHREVRRAGELIARFGGEEFMVIVPGASAEEVMALAERIRQAIVEEAMPHPSSSVAPVVTASLGVAVAVPHGEQDRMAWLEQVDVALYEAKHQGRNRVVMASA